MQKQFHQLSVSCLALLLTLSVSLSTASAMSLDEQISGSCQAIAKYLKSESVNTIAVGSFNGPGIGGIGISAKFEAKLKAVGLDVVPEDDDYDFKVHGEYKLFPASLEDFEEIDIEIKVTNALGAEARKFNETFVFSLDAGKSTKEFKPKDGKLKLTTRNPPEMSVILGKSTQFGNTGQKPTSSQHRDQQLDKLKETLEEKPPSHIDQNTIVRLSPDSPYGLQIIVDGHPVAPKAVGSKVRVVIPRGKIFSVVLHNRDRYEAAVELSMDGINTFAFSEIKAADHVSPAYKNWIVPRSPNAEENHIPGNTSSLARVQGWFINHNSQDLFKVTGFENSAVFKSKREADKLSGTIVATFSYAWEKGEDPPPEAFVDRGDQGDPFIGFGGRKEIKTERVERHVGPVREVIVIHYRDQ